MGIDYDGGMIVGELGRKLEVPDEFDGNMNDYIEEHDMDAMSLYFDADTDYQYIGFKVPNVMVSELDGDWLTDVKAKAEKFEELFYVPAKLVGTQNIW
jgi:hypothetical protein